LDKRLGKPKAGLDAMKKGKIVLRPSRQQPVLIPTLLYRVYYKRNGQFQYFIKPKLFKISTLAMHGFVEKLWKFYHCSP
jgi:hypothetical protein